MGSVSRLLKNTSFLVASNLTTKGLSAVFIVFLARYLQDYGFGQYNFALSFAAVFIIFSDLGLDALTIKNVARDRTKAGDYLELVGIIRMGISLIMVAAALVAGYIMGLDGYLLLVILVAGMAYLFDKLTGLFYALFRARERMELEAGVQMAWKGIQLALGFGAIYFGFSLLDIMLLMLVASVIKTIVGFSALLSAGVQPSRGGLARRDLLRNTAPFAAYEIGNTLYMNLVIIMLFFFQAPEDTGWFSAALRIILFLMLIPSAFDAAIYPLFARLYDSSVNDMKFAYGKSMKFSLVAVLPAAVMVAVLSEELAGLFGSNFENTARCLFVLSAFLPLYTLNMLMKTALWSGDAQNRMAANIWASVAVLAAASYLLVTEQGHVGAALALVIGEASLLAFNLAAVRRKEFPMGRYLWRPVLAGIGMAFAAYGFHFLFGDTVSSVYIAFVSLVVYLFLVLSVGVFTRSDRRIIAGLLSRNKSR